MAKAKKTSPTDLLKSRMKKQVDATNERVEIINGKKTKIGKYQTNNKTGSDKKPTEADLDKFFKQAEEGFRDIKAVAENDKQPYDNLLGRVEIERLVKITNK